MRRTDAAGLLALLSLVALAAWAGRAPDDGVVWRTLCVLAWTVASGLSVWLALRASSVRVVLGIALLLRALAFPMLPSLSDDAYRYLWDGRLVAAGVTPYAHTPDHPALMSFRAESDNGVLFERMNSPGVYSVYPPVSQAAFGLAGRAGSWEMGWFILKSIFVLVEGIGMFALARVLAPRHVALYAWHPLAVLEIAGQAHSEALLVGALGVAVWAAARRRHGVAALAVGVAGWTKLFPLAAVPSMVVRASWPVRLLALAAVALLGTPLLPADGWARVSESLRLYGGAFDFYSAPFRLTKWALYTWLEERAGPVASTALAALWLAALGRAMWRSRRTDDAGRRVLIVTFVGYAMVTPMLHPWNALGALLVAPMLLRPAPLLWLVGAAPITYLRYVGVAGAYEFALVVGWGGAAWLWWRGRQQASSARSDSTVTSSMEDQIASGIRRNQVS